MQSGAQPQARYHTQAAHLQQLLQACTCQVLPVPLVSRYAHFQQARLGAEKSSAKSQHRNEHALPQWMALVRSGLGALAASGINFGGYNLGRDEVADDCGVSLKREA